jgi:hypothetical protein
MSDVKAQVELERGEVFLSSWAAESVTRQHPKGEPGWLVLTSQRCLFFRQAGFFGGRRLDQPAAFSVRMEQIRSLSPRQFSMEIGYGDRVAVPGLELNGNEFRLNRDASSESVVGEIERARNPRLV